MSNEKTFQQSLNEKVQFWAAIFTIAGVVVPAVYFGVNLFLNQKKVSGNFYTFRYPSLSQPEDTRNEILDFHKDSSAILQLNQYLNYKIPLEIIKYWDPTQKDYLLDVERIRMRKIDDDLTKISNIICSTSNKQKISLDDLPHTVTKVLLWNDGNESIKNVRFDLDAFFIDNKDNNLKIGGWYQIDTLVNFSEDGEVFIGEIKPGKFKEIFIWSSMVGWFSDETPSILVSYDEGSNKIYQEFQITTNNSFDRFFTQLLINNTFIQATTYLLVPLGFIFLIFNVIPAIRSIFSRKKSTSL